MDNSLEIAAANQHIAALLGKYELLEKERYKLYHSWDRSVFRWKKNDLLHPLLKGSFFIIPATGLFLQQRYGGDLFAASGALLILVAVFISFLQAYDSYLYYSMREIKITAAYHSLQALEFRNRAETVKLLGSPDNAFDKSLANFFEDDITLRSVRNVDGRFYSSIEVWLLIIGTLIWAFG